MFQTPKFPAPRHRELSTFCIPDRNVVVGANNPFAPAEVLGAASYAPLNGDGSYFVPKDVAQA